jgi:hypothetical protein
LGFEPCAQRSGGSHEQWECIRGERKFKVTLDCHHGEVRALDVRSIIAQAGVTAKAFWRAVNQC